MILVCPNCAARYELDGANVPAEGRKVRCKKCSHVWRQQPEPGREEIEETIFNPPAVEPVPEPAPETEPESEPAIEPEWRAPDGETENAAAPGGDLHDDSVEPSKPAGARLARGAAWTIAGWIGLVAAILIIGWSAANYRSQIVGIWPKSATLFSSLGMAVNARGLDFANIRYTNRIEDGQPVLVISGNIVNVTGKKLDVPHLRVILSDEKNRGLYKWAFTPSRRALAPGASVGFHTRLSNPPAAARHVELLFVGGAKR